MTKPLTIVIDYVLLLMDCAVSLQVFLLMTEHFAFILGLEFINFLVLLCKLLGMVVPFFVQSLLILLFSQVTQPHNFLCSFGFITI